MELMVDDAAQLSKQVWLFELFFKSNSTNDATKNNLVKFGSWLIPYRSGTESGFYTQALQILLKFTPLTQIVKG